MSVEVDDTDSAIVYSGSWASLTGSSRQYKSTIHTTTQNGASATIKFHGTRIIVYQTVPIGDGTETVNSNLDGSLGSISRHSHSDTAYYQDIWFDSGPVTLGDHTLIVSNGGGPSDTPFELDRFHIEGSVISPVTTPSKTTAAVQQTVTKTAISTTTAAVSSSSSSLSASSSTTSTVSSAASSLSSNSTTVSSTQTPGEEKTVTAIQYITTSANGSIVTIASTSTSAPDRTTSATSKPPLGAIVGSVIGFLALILLLILGFCLRRRRQRRRSASKPRPRRTTDVTPYDLEVNASGHSLMRNGSQEMETGPNSRPLAISTSVLNSGERNPVTYPNGGTSDTNHSSPSEKNRDLFSNWTSPTSDIYATAPPIIGATSPSSYPANSGESNDSPYRPRYLSGDTLAAQPNHVFGVNALAPVDSNDIPPSYQSVRSRNSNIPAQSRFN